MSTWMTERGDLLVMGTVELAPSVSGREAHAVIDYSTADRDSQRFRKRRGSLETLALSGS